MVKTYSRFILASNEHKPLHLEESERRWYVPSRLVHRQDRFETQAFIQQLANWLALPGSLCSVYNYFMTYPLEGFNHKSVPHSTGLAAIVDMSKNVHAEFVEGFIAENTVFTHKELIDAFVLEGHNRPSDQHVPYLIRDVGYQRGTPRIDGKQIRLYHPIGMGLEEIRAAYKERASF